MSRILELEAKMRRGERLSESDLPLARIHLESSAIKERVIAYELILYGGENEERQRLIPAIENECAQAIDSKGNYPPTLLFVLRRMPLSTVESSRVLRRFVISAATEGRTGSRMNSISLLEKLATAGDSAALEAMTSSLSDEDARVRANAEWSMARIRGTDR
jgi:hypothetical protein